MWANEWDEATKSFQYIDFGVDMEGQTDASSPDGNGLIVTGFGFIYKVTGDALYKERGDLVFDGLVGTATEGAWLEGSKQFNQAYNSLNYLGYAYGDGELPLPSALQIILGTAGADTLYGTTADEIIEGLANNDTLEGRGGSDTLDGGSGNDLLNGGLGSDVLIGGLGSDTYIVDNASDVVVEEGLGTDTVIVGTSYVLSSGVSVEVIRTSNAAAKTALNLTGNSFGQTFCGTAGANVLNSGLNAAGHRDLLYGYNGVLRRWRRRGV